MVIVVTACEREQAGIDCNTTAALEVDGEYSALTTVLAARDGRPCDRCRILTPRTKKTRVAAQVFCVCW